MKSTLQDSLHSDLPEVSVETEGKDFSVIALVELKNLSDSQEQLEENSSAADTENKLDENKTEDTEPQASAENVSEEKSTDVVKSEPGSEEPVHMPESPRQSLPTETKTVGLETKERKSEDRQSNTPSPPVSTFSSGTSTTSDIEVLDHESVISESSVSSRQEAADSKASLHLMQTSFQLLSASACTEYNRLDDFQKLTESCCSSDAFERIDSFSVQSLDSRSVSEINSDDELSGRGCISTSVTVGPPTPKSDVVDPVKSKSDQIVSEALVLPADEAEMEESGRSATPVNSEQPDVLVVPTRTVEEHATPKEAAAIHHSAEKLSSVECEKEELCKVIPESALKIMFSCPWDIHGAAWAWEVRCNSGKLVVGLLMFFESCSEWGLLTCHICIAMFFLYNFHKLRLVVRKEGCSVVL